MVFSPLFSQYAEKEAPGETPGEEKRITTKASTTCQDSTTAADILHIQFMSNTCVHYFSGGKQVVKCVEEQG